MVFNVLPATKITVNRNPKVTPAEKTLKRNNFISCKPSLSIQAIKYLIVIEFIFGVNRLSLFKQNKFALLISYVYSIVLLGVVIGIMYTGDQFSMPYVVWVAVCCVEYIILLSNSLLTSKNKFTKLFRDLDEFDELLNISHDLNITNSVKTGVFWLSACFVYSFCEYIACFFCLTFFLDRMFYCIYIMLLAHDCEQILMFVLLKIIYTRLCVIKGHILKVFPAEHNMSNYNRKLNKLEALSNNAQLDINSLHRVYDLLHKCAEQLNSIMTVPTTAIVLSAGMGSTLLLKMLVKVIETFDFYDAFGQSTIAFLFGRVMKLSGLLVVPCYYSRATSVQVAAIRTCLYDALYSYPMDKIERRKVKAFFQLTRHNEFTYSLGGVIRLNMSLPLSYMSLCTTYLVIFVQFSKFFD